MENMSTNILHSKIFAYIKYIFLFLLLSLVFFIYQSHVVTDFRLNLIIIIVSAVVFIVSLLNFKYALYFFIFLVPLLNSIPNVLRIENKPVILFVFLALVLGYIINRIISLTGWSRDKISYSGNYAALFRVIGIFIAIFSISAVITIFRYSNFFPFITDNYHNLAINVNGIDSTYAIFWTINFFFNYIVGFILLFFIIKTFHNFDDIKNSVLILISSTVVASLVLLYQYFLNPLWGNSEAWVAADRFNGTFNDPNSLGSFTVMLFPIFLGFILYIPKWYKKIILILLFLPFLFSIFASGSRNAFVGIFISIIIMVGVGIRELILWMNKKIKKKRTKAWIWSVLGLIAIAIIVFLVVSSLNLKPELAEIDKPENTSISLVDRMVETYWMAYNTFFKADLIEAFKSVSSYRYALWEQAAAMFKDHPVTGVGLGSYILQLPNYYVKNNSNVFEIDFTGNYYLQLLSELGLPGLLLVLSIFFLILVKVFFYYRYNKRLYRSQGRIMDGMVISFIAMIGSLFLGPHTNFFEIQFTFWLILALILKYTGQGRLYAE